MTFRGCFAVRFAGTLRQNLFRCRKQAKTRKGTSISFHVLQKDFYFILLFYLFIYFY